MEFPTLEGPLDDALGAVAVAVTVTLSPVLAPRYRRWGAADAECEETLPGDEHVRYLRLQATRAIDIDAPPAAVWPWLVQIGHGRAGLYSYEGLENLAGCKIHNADRIEPAWQALRVGDKVALGPAGYPAYEVGAVDAPRLFLLTGGDDPRGPQSSWAFVLRPRDDGRRTRLVVRSRYGYPSTLGQHLIWRALTEPIHFVMERRMLLGLRARAERTGLLS